MNSFSNIRVSTGGVEFFIHLMQCSSSPHELSHLAQGLSAHLLVARWRTNAKVCIVFVVSASLYGWKPRWVVLFDWVLAVAHDLSMRFLVPLQRKTRRKWSGVQLSWLCHPPSLPSLLHFPTQGFQMAVPAVCISELCFLHLPEDYTLSTCNCHL